VALHDTGNRLTDPYVHAPVHIAAKSVVERLMPDGKGCRLLPFSTVGAMDGLMEVWTIDAMEWAGGRIEHVVIGAAGDALFEGKDYRMILAAGWQGLSK